jgi:hypothetical protein
MRGIASRVRLAVRSSDEEADGSQHEHDGHRSELTESCPHSGSPDILHLFLF